MESYDIITRESSVLPDSLFVISLKSVLLRIYIFEFSCFPRVDWALSHLDYCYIRLFKIPVNLISFNTFTVHCMGYNISNKFLLTLLKNFKPEILPNGKWAKSHKSIFLREI